MAESEADIEQEFEQMLYRALTKDLEREVVAKARAWRVERRRILSTTYSGLDKSRLRLDADEILLSAVDALESHLKEKDPA